MNRKPESEVEKDAGYRGVRPASSPLHAPWGAALPWNQRQLWPGIGGSFGLESAAALLWNQWQHSCGTGGSFAVELVAGFTWNRWQLWRGIRNLPPCSRGSNGFQACGGQQERMDATHAARTRLLAPALPWSPPPFSDGTVGVWRCGLPPWPMRAASALRKTRNSFFLIR